MKTTYLTGDPTQCWAFLKRICCGCFIISAKLLVYLSTSILSMQLCRWSFTLSFRNGYHWCPVSGFFSDRETKERWPGLENVTRPSINKVLRRKRVTFKLGVNCPFKFYTDSKQQRAHKSNEVTELQLFKYVTHTCFIKSSPQLDVSLFCR